MTNALAINTHSKVLLRSIWAFSYLLLVSFAVNLSAETCSEEETISVHCGDAPSAAFDNEGNLWVAFVQNQFVYVSKSADLGKSFTNPVRVNSIAEDAEHNGENRPKIIVDDSSTVFVSWTEKTSPRFTGEIRFSRSTDGGNSFEEPRTINDDELFTGHRFDSLFLTESGHLYLTWIDKRDLVASEEKGVAYAGAAIYYAVSSDKGASFSDNYRVSSNSCECCRIAIAPSGNENITILWRQIFAEDIRDHAIATLSPSGEVIESHRASFDDWHINACPHHGPTLISADNGQDYHMSWFTNGDLQQGIYYAKFSADSKSPSLVTLVDNQAGAGHPFLASHAGVLHLVWKGFDGSNTQLKGMQSTDDGQTWNTPDTLLVTSESSDHPLIVSNPDGLYLSWHTDEYGYVVKPLTDSVELSSNAQE